jgi:hypothetical protein
MTGTHRGKNILIPRIAHTQQQQMAFCSSKTAVPN